MQVLLLRSLLCEQNLGFLAHRQGMAVGRLTIPLPNQELVGTQLVALHFLVVRTKIECDMVS